MHQTLQQRGRKFSRKGRCICISSESLLTFATQLICDPSEWPCAAALAWVPPIRAVPWKSSDLPPLLHAEAPGPVAAPERGKAFVGNAGRACDKLAAQTHIRTGPDTRLAEMLSHQHSHHSPNAHGKAFAKQGHSWGTSKKWYFTWRLRANRPFPARALEEAT